MSWRKFLLVPALARSGMRAPRNAVVAWNRYWAGIERTGVSGDVLWDADSEAELGFCVSAQRRHMDPSLPLLDVGCGNGRFTRALAQSASSTLGVDLSSAAIERARAESAGIPNLSYETLDITAPGVGAELHRGRGDEHAFVRGVLHVLAHREKIAAIENLRVLLGERGLLLLLETAFEGSILDYLEYLGATARHFPSELRRCVETGIPKPSRFGPAELARYFMPSRWRTLASGSAEVHAVALRPGHRVEVIPGFFAVMKPEAQR